MFVDWIIGALIFGYAAWTLYRLVKKSRQGKCGACSKNSECKRAQMKK